MVSLRYNYSLCTHITYTFRRADIMTAAFVFLYLMVGVFFIAGLINLDPAFQFERPPYWLFVVALVWPLAIPFYFIGVLFDKASYLIVDNFDALDNLRHR